MKQIETLYKQIGARFVSPISEIQLKLKEIKAFVFDWDGVFNNGRKTINGGGSGFSETDSMGVNLLRYSYFLKHGSIPITAILSGEKNEAAFYFCERESIMYSFYKVARKKEALNFLCKKNKISPQNVAYFFDDVLDLSVAQLCGLRLMVNQKANPLFINYCVNNGLTDYLSANSGGQFSVREITELLIGLYGNYNEVITNRKHYNDSYKKYLGLRKAIVTELFTLKENGIEQM